MTTDSLGTIPRYAIYRKRRVRIAWYESGEKKPFHIVDSDDTQREVARDDLIFLPDKKPKTGTAIRKSS
jgi:hypothetical protein